MEDLDNVLVRYSRAGDAFHYRWAARRCLNMIYPLSRVKYIVIEGSGSKERELAGEYAIDVSEYIAKQDNDEIAIIKYFQLKHTTVRKDSPITISQIRSTIIGFAKRYSDHLKKEHSEEILFYLVTNRPVSQNFKNNLLQLKEGKECNDVFKNTIEKYTELSGERLTDFCRVFAIFDGLSDYYDQYYELHAEISHLLAGIVDHPQIDTITALVGEKVLPNSNGIVIPEDIFKRFGCTSARDMYPAPAEYEKINSIIKTKQQNELIKIILDAQEAIIIHAAGGVGKSVFAREIPHIIPNNSIAIIYDCFGAGKYRNRSQPRHRYRDGIIQITNELAIKGLCDPLITQPHSLDDEILRKFLIRLNTSIKNLKEANDKAHIIIVIDAADNAEMAAKEVGDTCFVHELLREKLPEDCHLVMLCRTERIGLLQHNESIPCYELLPFSEFETFAFMQKRYPDVTIEDGLEFHRLTSGNPRVQSNALNTRYASISEMLEDLGPGGNTVENQIDDQLEKAIGRIKNRLTPSYQKHIDAICCGLSTLPPLIPISILATAAEVTEDEVKSFVAELGRSIWISESVIQFRDEPTETWFRKKFSSNRQQIIDYIHLLKPHANRFAYVAEVLPILLHQAELYSELIELALSDNLLPKNNPIDKRNAKIFRLQFSFKAALKTEQLGDAVKIAMLAGEEMAGNKRQLEIFKKNVDLIARLQDKQKVQELAFKRMLSGTWEGSENLFSASLLSSIPEFHGEARAYLRSSVNWLSIYFQERDRKEDHYRDQLEDDEIAELVFTQYNLYGDDKAVDFLFSWKPSEVIYSVARIFFRKMIDHYCIDSIIKMSELGSKNTYLILALSHELLKVGKFLHSSVLEFSLDELAKGQYKMPRLEDTFQETILSSVISFAEMCAVSQLPNEKIRQLLDNYFPINAPNSIDSNYHNEVRVVFLRVVALRKSLNSSCDMNFDSLLLKMISNTKQDVQKFREIPGALLPWYFCRIQVLLNNYDDLATAIQITDKNSGGILNTRYRSNEIITFEICDVFSDILLFSKNYSIEDIHWFYNEYISNNKHMRIDSYLRILRGANRLEHLYIIRNQLIKHTRDAIDSFAGDTDQIVQYHIELSRAVVSIDKRDAAEYFNIAIEKVSRFGDEIINRWQAVESLGNQSYKEGTSSPELSYRFIRCAELVGINVVREKYFNRDEAVKICTKLSPASGLAAISRWRDRNVGDFDRQFPVVVKEIVNNGFISPKTAWGLAPLLDISKLPDFVLTCLRKETIDGNRRIILDSAIDYLRKHYTPITVWNSLKHISNELSISNNKLDDICLVLNSIRKENSEIPSQKGNVKNRNQIRNEDLANIFLDTDLTCPNDISLVLERFSNTKDSHQNKEVFWDYLFDHLPQNSAIQFMEAFISADQVDIYKIVEAFSHLPEYWMEKPSVQKAWPAIVKRISKSSAINLLNIHNLERLQKALRIAYSERQLIYNGLIEGLSEKERLDTADVFFDFVTIIVDLLEPTQARELLDFSLSRFEIHMDDDFADGRWAHWLHTSDDGSRAISGFIWSALGSPSPVVRWKAAHCVKFLGDNRCQSEIDSLIEWLEKDQVASFGSNKYPFYNLHARLYLLVALARISIDKPELLQRHTSVLLHYSLSDMPHIQIQMFAAKTALSIERAFPGTFDQNTLDLLVNVNRSPYPEKVIEDYNSEFSSYLHQADNDDSELKFSHGYDFDRYWFEPLGRIFGISEKHTDEMATMVIKEDLKICYDGEYSSDPRNELWNSHQFNNATYHSHGEYPKVEMYSFYLSYHAMLIVASRLIQSMPVLKDDRWDEENIWDEWLRKYSLTMTNGLWLYDYRDAIPLKEPRWLQGDFLEEWLETISDNDFHEALLLNDSGDDWINVCGAWEYGRDIYRESVYISSALVSSISAPALLSALSSCEDPHDFKLPDYKEERMEFTNNTFVLKGWIKKDNSIDGIDSLDELSGYITYPGYQIGDEYFEELNLKSDGQQKKWYLDGQPDPCLTCANWSFEISNYYDSQHMKGLRLSASLEVLMKLCAANMCELIIDIQIYRRTSEDRFRQSNKSTYTSSKHKVYLFSQDGRLTDDKGIVNIRKTSC